MYCVRGLVALRTALGTGSQKIKAKTAYKGRHQRLMHHRNALKPQTTTLRVLVSNQSKTPSNHDNRPSKPKHAYLNPTIATQLPRPKEIVIIVPSGRQSRSYQHRISSFRCCSQLHTTFPSTSTSASLEHRQDACSLHPSL